MRNRGDARAASAIVAAMAGTGCASGREIALFFGQPGWAGWIGIVLAALVFGLLTALLCRWAARYDAASFTGLCRSLLGKKTAPIALWLYRLLLGITALTMLFAAGRIGALALPLRFSFLWGLGIALLLALLSNLARLRPLPWLGAALLSAGTVFYIALALDPRPVRVYLSGEAELALEDSLPAALAMALGYAAMNVCVTAGTAVRFGRRARPGHVGLRCAMALLAILTGMNAALARGGRTLLFQRAPTVLLAARWGLAGFWLCAGFSFLCVTATLSAVMNELLYAYRITRFAAAATFSAVKPNSLNSSL